MSAGQRVATYSVAGGLLASVLVHALAFMLVTKSTAGYDFDFEITAPSEVEFGLTEAMPSALNHAGFALGASQDSEPERRPKPELSGDGDGAEPEPSRTPPGDDRGGQPDEEEPPPLPVAAAALEGGSRLPPGTQIALRLDLQRVRRSPLAADVSRLVEGIPDWRMLLSGSNIDPVQDLDRLLVASPNLQRSRLVVAGMHRREPGYAEERVTELAKARGKRVRWRTRYGVQTASWHNRDSTPRTIALLGPQIFSITRNEDLRRVLAMAKARELRDPSKEGLVAARGPEALLSMGPEEVLTVEVEGARRFIVGNDTQIPLRMRLAVVETGPREATVQALASYGSAAEARGAAKYWQTVADHYADNLWLSMAGFGNSFRSLQIRQEKKRLRIVFRLGHEQIRVVLSFLEGRLQSQSHAYGHKKRGRGAPF